MKYEKHIRQLQLEAEMVKGKVCKCKEHKHILATTLSCLVVEPEE